MEDLTSLSLCKQTITQQHFGDLDIFTTDGGNVNSKVSILTLLFFDPDNGVPLRLLVVVILLSLPCPEQCPKEEIPGLQATQKYNLLSL